MHCSEGTDLVFLPSSDEALHEDIRGKAMVYILMFSESAARDDIGTSEFTGFRLPTRVHPGPYPRTPVLSTKSIIGTLDWLYLYSLRVPLHRARADLQFQPTRHRVLYASLTASAHRLEYVGIIPFERNAIACDLGAGLTRYRPTIVSIGQS